MEHTSLRGSAPISNVREQLVLATSRRVDTEPLEINNALAEACMLVLDFLRRRARIPIK
jgi:hypothetical protein